MKSTILKPDDSRLIVDDQHPWLGLNAYTEESQAYFFGRNTAINELFTRVRENRLTTLFGQSGLGKTSLLGAGLLPKLKVEGYRPQLIRLNFSEDAPSLVDQTRLALCKALEIESVNAGATLWEILHHIDYRPKDLLQSLPVLVFDQFEEIFTLSGSRQAEVVAWFTQIADLVENRPPEFLQKQFRSDRQQARKFDTTVTPVRIVLALREDYLSHLERWKSMMPSLMRNRMALHLLNGPEALEAAVCPGKKGSHPIVSEEVGMQIVRKVARRPDNTPMDEIEAVPPFLSLLCEQLNAARLKSSPQSAEISSGLVTTLGDDILSNYYEESFANHPAALRHFVEDQLVSSSGHRNTLPLEDAEIELKTVGVQNALQAINALIARRLLAAEERNGITRLELTHDLLTPLAVRSRTTRREKEAFDKDKQQRRHQMKIASILMVLTLLFAALAVWSWLSYQRADKAKSEALQTLSRSDFIQGSEYLEQDRSSEGMAYLARAIRTDNTNLSAVARLYSALVYTVYPLPLFPPMQHQSSVNSAAFSPDGRFVVTASYDNTARVWDAQTGKPVSQPMQHQDKVRSAAFSPDGRFVVTASDDKTARVWDAQTGKPVSQPMQHQSSVNSAAFSPDGRFVVTASSDKTARVWDAKSGKPVSQPMQHEIVYSAAFSPDGRFVVTASSDKTARVWDAKSGKPVSQPMQHEGAVYS
ncbi:MAG: WD40 repeat domain-containing protein, partial [Pelodictyon phaeoclathratiforme]